MSEIDDSYLLHYSKGYDPVKAREYYLRTRQLKGRRPAAGDYDAERGRKYYRQVQKMTGNEEYAATSEARKQLEEQKAALKKRLERLDEVLAELVRAAKSRSGIKTEPAKTKSDPEDTPKDKASRNESAKKDTPLTSAEKAKKAKEAREQYQKENKGPSLSTEVKQLQTKIKAVQAQIEKARAEAAKRNPKPKPQTAVNNGR